MYIYLFVCLFVCLRFFALLSYSNLLGYCTVVLLQLFGYFCKHNIMHITYLNIQKMKIYSLTTLVSITII